MSPAIFYGALVALPVLAILAMGAPDLIIDSGLRIQRVEPQPQPFSRWILGAYFSAWVLVYAGAWALIYGAWPSWLFLGACGLVYGWAIIKLARIL